jgi:hypothetical protein
MIVKKLAAPLINEKILQQAVHCSIATTAISDSAFDFIRTRISPKTKIDMVTGLDEPTSPKMLRAILKHYLDRIVFNIYTRNTVHANVYIFDLPFKKSIAFIGSGHLTLAGIKDHEEIFYKISDPKEIEALKSWFTGYFEFGEPLTEEIVNEYELIYPSLKRKQNEARIEKREALDLASRVFSWEAIKFKNQYFKKEDYLVASIAKSGTLNPIVVEERTKAAEKFETLHTSLKGVLASKRLMQNGDRAFLLSVNPLDYADKRVRSIGLSYAMSGTDGMQLRVSLSQNSFSVYLFADYHQGATDRNQIQSNLSNEDYRKRIFEFASALGRKYFIEVAAERRWLGLLQSAETFAEFLREDDWPTSRLMIGKVFHPGDAELNNDNITATLTEEIEKIFTLYQKLLPPLAGS